MNVFNDQENGLSLKEQEDGIKQFASDQRLALPDEPVCVICGKYGEYINDDTDQDICSLQCKAIDNDLNSNKRPKKIRKIDKDAIINTHLHDYVASNLHAKLTNYQEPESISIMSSQQVQHMLKAHDIHVSGTHIPKPFSTFDQLCDMLGPQLLHNIESLGWSMATGIQRQAVTVGLAGRDLNVIAPTSSGKTGAFLIPTIVHCMSLSALDNDKRRAGPYALIMAPTRELCSQIERVCQQLSKNIRNLRTGLLIGGEPVPTQIHRLKRGVQIIIGTPGRILDIATYHPKLLRVWKIQMVVVDEADAMVSMGFGAQVRQIFGKFPNTTVRQTSLFSATQAPDASLYKKLKSPVEIKVEQQQQQQEQEVETRVIPETSDRVRQTVLWVENKSKAKKLFSILRNRKYFVVPILIFVASKLGSEFLTRAIQKKMPHLRVAAMHSEKTQEERDAIIDGINKTDEPVWDVVVSTDVLARGVNLPCVRLVINYDMTATLEEYVHRVGRAISQKKQGDLGRSLTFINEEHRHLLKPFATMLSRKSAAIVTPLPPQLKRYL